MKKKTKQILAILMIVILVGLSLATLVFALLDFPGSDRLFQACLFATIALPILLWIYIWGYGALTHTKNMASFFPDDEEDKDEEGMS